VECQWVGCSVVSWLGSLSATVVSSVLFVVSKVRENHHHRDTKISEAAQRVIGRNQMIK
jgi:hypothetical protein